jgi:hypothetical protein
MGNPSVSGVARPIILRQSVVHRLRHYNGVLIDTEVNIIRRSAPADLVRRTHLHRHRRIHRTRVHRRRRMRVHRRRRIYVHRRRLREITPVVINRRTSEVMPIMTVHRRTVPTATILQGVLKIMPILDRTDQTVATTINNATTDSLPGHRIVLQVHSLNR